MSKGKTTLIKTPNLKKDHRKDLKTDKMYIYDVENAKRIEYGVDQLLAYIP